MIQEILKEELGISNEVCEITSKIKQKTSYNYSLHMNDKDFYSKLNINDKVAINVFVDGFIISYGEFKIKIYIRVLNNCSEYYDVYLKTYDSFYSFDHNLITLFLTSKNGKIEWNKHSSSLQHEVEHFYQANLRNKPYLSSDVNNKETIKYNRFIEMLKSKDFYLKKIGLVFYLSYKYERDAYINGLYEKIMEINSESYIQEPIKILKNYQPYIRINNLKKFLETVENNLKKKNELLEKLNNENIDYKTFLNKANWVIKEYTRGFARVIYKSKKDIMSKFPPKKPF